MDFEYLWNKETEALREYLRTEQHIRVLGPWGAFWVFMQGQAKD